MLSEVIKHHPPQLLTIKQPEEVKLDSEVRLLCYYNEGIHMSDETMHPMRNHRFTSDIINGKLVG